MPYGDQINAGLMNVDYSPVVQAGQNRANMIMSAGKSVSGLIGQLGQMKEQQKQEDADISVGVQIAKLLEQKSPGLIPGAGDLALGMSDTNIPRQERLGMAKYILNALSIGTKIQEEQRQQEELGLRGRQLAMQERESNFRMQPQADALDSYLSFPSGNGSIPNSGVLPPKGGVPSNQYVDGLDPNSIPQY